MDYANENCKIGCIIMASGVGKRFGSNKLMADFSGKPLITYIINAIQGASFSNRVVVTRHENVAALCKEFSIDVLLHNQPLRNDVIRLGLAHLQSFPLSGCMFCPSDQPLLSTPTIEKLILSFRQQPEKIHRLCFQSQPGSPVIFPAKYFQELSALPAEKGGGYLIKQYPNQVIYVPVDNPYELKDIDTQEDLDFLLHK